MAQFYKEPALTTACAIKLLTFTDVTVLLQQKNTCSKTLELEFSKAAN